MIAVATEGEVAFRSHFPALIFCLLIFVALRSAFLAGYGMAKSERRSLLHMFLYAACIWATIYAVSEPEQPRSGLIRLDQVDRGVDETVRFDSVKPDLLTLFRFLYIYRFRRWLNLVRSGTLVASVPWPAYVRLRMRLRFRNRELDRSTS